MVMALGFSILTPMFADQALAASSRAASVVEVKGTAYLKKAGGTKPYRLFKRMTVNQGDTIITEAASSVVLNVIDRDDEVTIGENSEVYMADLLDDEGTKTTVRVSSGNVSSNVSKLQDRDTFKIETPNATMGVRGTHFMLFVDPATGTVRMIVNSGKVGLDLPEGEEMLDHNRLIYPSQQVTLFVGDSGQLDGYVSMPDLPVEVDASIIEDLLRNKERIEQENEEYLRGLAAAEEELPDGVADLDALIANVHHAVESIIKAAIDKGILNEEELDAIIEEVNRNLEPGRTPLDREFLRNLPGDLPDPMEEERRRQREEAEQRRQQLEHEREQRRQQAEDEQQEMLERIKQQREEQEQQNKEARERREREAVDHYRNQLSDDEREQLERRLEERERERTGQQPQTPPETTAPNPAPGGGDDPGEGPGDPNEGKPAAKLKLREDDEGRMYVDVILSNIPEGLYGAELHLLFDAEQYAALPDDEGGWQVETAALAEIFSDFVIHTRAETGQYIWENGTASPATELLAAILSLGEAAHDPVDEIVLLSIPLDRLVPGENRGNIILKDIRLVDDNGQLLSDAPLITIDLEDDF